MESAVTGRMSLAAALVTQARRQSGLSQRELARRAGVSRTTVAEIESGGRDPGLNTLRAVLSGVGLDLDIHLIAKDDHDEVLDRTLAHLPESDRARLEHGFERFVQGLADGLADSRPLINSHE